MVFNRDFDVYFSHAISPTPKVSLSVITIKTQQRFHFSSFMICVLPEYITHADKRGAFTVSTAWRSTAQAGEEFNKQTGREWTSMCVYVVCYWSPKDTVWREQSRHTQKAVHSTLWCSGYGFERRHPWCSADQRLQVFLLRHKKTQLWQALKGLYCHSCNVLWLPPAGRGHNDLDNKRGSYISMHALAVTSPGVLWYEAHWEKGETDLLICARGFLLASGWNEEEAGVLTTQSHIISSWIGQL